MKKIVLGADGGNYMMKMAGPCGIDSFRSNISMTFKNNVTEKFGDDDMEFEVNGIKGIAGTIAIYETRTGNSSTGGGTKNHPDAKTRILLGVHRYITKYGLYDVKKVSVVVGQPIKAHVPTEKQAIINMLEGTHDVTVNGVKMEINIDHAAVAPEGVSAFWSMKLEKDATYHMLDVGSFTVNAATLTNHRHINSKSDTFDFGAETMIGATFAQIAYEVVRASTTLSWNKDAKVLLCGGIARELLPHVQSYYPNADLVYPEIIIDESPIVLGAGYANAVGNYNIAKGAFK